MFIDMHAHAYRRPVPFVVQFCTAEEVLRRYGEAEIDQGVLLPIVSPEIYLPQANEDILDMAEQHPGRFIPWCNIDPRALTHSADAPLDRLLRYYRDRGCRGVGEIMINVPMMDERVQNLFKHAEQVGLPVTFDGSDRVGGDFGMYDDPGLPQLEHTLQRFPALLMIAHGPIFWSELGGLQTPGQRKTAFRPDGGQVGITPWQGPIHEEGAAPVLMRRYPNLHAELSDGYRMLACDPDFGAAFLTEFQDRLYFGTDLCHVDQPLLLRDLLLAWRDEGRISAGVFAKLARGNAARLLGLETESPNERTQAAIPVLSTDGAAATPSEDSGDLRIRPLAPERDAQAVARIVAGSWQGAAGALMEQQYGLIGGKAWDVWLSRDILAYLDRDDVKAYAAERDGRVAGFCSYAADRERNLATVGYNAVARTEQGRGLGSRMMSFIMDRIREEGFQYAAVIVADNEAHAPARRVYEKHGFRRLAGHEYLVQKLG